VEHSLPVNTWGREFDALPAGSWLELCLIFLHVVGVGISFVSLTA